MRHSGKRLLLSDTDIDVCESLYKLGYEIILTNEIKEFLPMESSHADMQCLICEDQAFILPQCQGLADMLSVDFNVHISDSYINEKYPNNIALNTLILDDYIIGKSEFTDRKVLEFARNKGLKSINVNQGYTRCSCAVVNGRSVITEDESIYRALKNTDVDVLKIQKGHVRLKGAEYGFIGGASGLIEDNVLFFTGDITRHPDYMNIKLFCDEKKVTLKFIENKYLTDIGGIIRI